MRRSRSKPRKQCDLCSDTHSTLWRPHNNFLLCDSCFTLLQASKQKAERRAVEVKRNASNISNDNNKNNSDDAAADDDNNDDDSDTNRGSRTPFSDDASKEASDSDKATTPESSRKVVPDEDAPPTHKKPRASSKSGSKHAAGSRESKKNRPSACQALWQLDTSYAHPLISALTHNATAKYIEKTLEKVAASRQRHRKQSRPLRCDAALVSTNARSADVAKSRRPWPTLRPFVSYRALISSDASNAIGGASCQRSNGAPADHEPDKTRSFDSDGTTPGADRDRAVARANASAKCSSPQNTKKHWRVFLAHDVFLGENYDLFSVGPSVHGVNASMCVDAIQEHLVQSVDADTAESLVSPANAMRQEM